MGYRTGLRVKESEKFFKLKQARAKMKKEALKNFLSFYFSDEEVKVEEMEKELLQAGINAEESKNEVMEKIRSANEEEGEHYEVQLIEQE